MKTKNTQQMLSGWLAALPGVRLRAASATGGARRRTIPENSHSRAMRSLRFSTLRLPVSPTGRGRLRCQVPCCTFTKDEPGENMPDENEKHPANAECFSFGIRQRPTLPGRLQPSTIGAERLNFCVRYGNRWIPFAIVTGMLSRGCTVRVLLGFRFVYL